MIAGQTPLPQGVVDRLVYVADDPGCPSTTRQGTHVLPAGSYLLASDRPGERLTIPRLDRCTFIAQRSILMKGLQMNPLRVWWDPADTRKRGLPFTEMLKSNCQPGVARRAMLRFGITFVAVGSWLVMFIAHSASGQQAAQDGRALDNNLQQGTGGVNQAQQPLPIYGGNNVITGNVPGLGYFRDEVGYTAPNEFRDVLADDQLFRFRAQSLPPSAIAPAGNPVSPVGVYRSFAGLDLRDISQRVNPAIYGSYGSNQDLAARDGLIVRYQPAAGTADVLPTPPLGASLRVDMATNNRLGWIQQPDGQLWQLQATPLLGLRREKVQRRFDYRGVRLDPQEQTPTDDRAGPSVPGDDPGDNATDSDSADNPDLRASARIDGEVYPWSPSMELGLYLQARLAGHPNDRAVPLTDQRVAHMASTLLHRPGASDIVQGEDVYLDLLGQIRQQAQQPVSRLLPPSGDAADPLPGSSSSTNPPPDLSPDSTPDQSPDSTLDPSSSASPDATDPLSQLLETLDYDLPRLSTLAGSRDDLINQLMRDAEADMSRGRYFDAEARYQQILQLVPGHPQATIGQVHAQLGGGLIRSTAWGLRRLFEQHPELIAARYNPPVLPDAKRLDRIKEQLEETLQLSTQHRHALVLAYIGYQTDSTDLTQRGFDLAQQDAPNDPLLTLLRLIWLDRSSDGADAIGGDTTSPSPATTGDAPAYDPTPRDPMK